MALRLTAMTNSARSTGDPYANISRTVDDVKMLDIPQHRAVTDDEQTDQYLYSRVTSSSAQLTGKIAPA